MNGTKKKVTAAVIAAAILAILQASGVAVDWLPIRVSVEVGTKIVAPSAATEAK